MKKRTFSNFSFLYKVRFLNAPYIKKKKPQEFRILSVFLILAAVVIYQAFLIRGTL